MQPLQRASVRAARHIRPQAQRQCRRHASDSHNKPTNETMGAGFYITLAALPASFAVFKFTKGDDSPLTTWIRDTYNGYAEKWAQRNDLHVQALEQAAADKVLFLNESTKGPHRNVDLRFPEQFNVGSPWNVPAGHGGGNLDQVIAKYEKEAYEDQAKKLQGLKENKVPVEQPFEALTMGNVATPSGD